MNKYVLLTVVLIISLISVSSFPAFADFFNGNLLKDKSEDFSRHKIFTAGTIPDSSGLPKEESAPHIRPLKDYTRPIITYSDSIDTGAFRIKQFREIKGLDNEPFAAMTIDQYINKNLEKKFYNTWQDNKGRFKKWSESSVDRSGGITDLDFVVPGSKALERFVGGETRINIDGREKITFSGRSEWTEGQIETSVSKNSSFPSLTMKQEPSFRINGDVGRVHVDIKQDPQSGQFSNLEENISIKYQGEDRDIIKYIEAGNTSLTLEGATFAGYRGSHKGLFGIRAEGRLGPLKYTTIASQEKSEANVKTFRGSAQESSTQIRDYEYKSNAYFFIDFTYRSAFRDNRNSFDLIRYNPADSLVVIEVYEDDSNIGNNLYEGTFALRGEAYPMDMEENTENPDAAVQGYFHKLEPVKDYYVDRSLGYIQFTRRVPDESTIGIYMETKDGRVYGSLDYDTTDERSKIKLKLIKRKKQLPTDTETWNLEWKNVYDLGQRQIDAEGLEIRIYREATDGVSKDTQNGTPFIHILGLDKSDEYGNPNPDNKIDLNRGFINFYRGELIFPDLEPFNAKGPLPGISVDLNEKVEKIYNTQNRQEKVEASKYYIEVKTANRQSVIQIGGGMMGIMEGTEQVLLNGRVLTRGKDYRIDYMSGRITLTNEEALSPTADLQIRYEEPNVFQQMQKTLVGVRGELDIFSNSRISAVSLFKNESTKDRRIKLGQEPSRTILFDTDAQFNFESKFLTSMVDKLPFLVASETSTIKLETELARSMPTLNTRGVVYIDDFEGSHNTPIGIVRSKWTMASAPDPSTTGGKLLKRGRLQWYNPWDRVKSKSIWPNKETTAGENTVHVLNLAYGKPEDVPMDESFAGVMSTFYGAGDDMSRSRFIEIWARGAKGELKFDIGSISEDFFPSGNPNGLLDTEDKPIPGQGHGDGILVKEEDTGLDGLFDKQEPGYSADNPDPSGDNFSYNSKNKNDYSRINGTEGNASDGDRMGFPDTEDINRNGILDVRNNYYEYTISFSDPFNPYLVPDSVPAADPHGWRLFRIPLWNNPLAVVGGSSPPDSTLIEFARMWITNTDSTLIQIASIQIVESTWLEQGIEGENVLNDNVRASNVNTHENREYYPPPGVKAEIDRETKIRKKEQSLVLKVEDLGPGNNAFIYRNFEKMSFTDYTALKMYVYGPDDFPGPGEPESDVELILRFGGDKNNYYEYRTQVFRGWDERNFIELDFSKCTALKLTPRYDDYLAHPDSLSTVADTTGTKIYTLSGKPSLDNVKIISIGIKNNNKTRNLNCDIWVNELRMDSERDMTGTAARVNLNTNLAGFMNITAAATKKSSDFHDMNSKSGSGQDNINWNTNVSVNLQRFTPTRWNLHLPVSASIRETSALPRLMSGSDIILNESQKKDYESTTSDKKYRISYSKTEDKTLTGIKGMIARWSFDKVDASYDFGQQTSSSPFMGKSLSDNHQVIAGYDVNPKGKTFKPFNWLPIMPFEFLEKFADMDFAYTPKQLNYKYTYNEKNQFRTNVDAVSDTTKNKTANEQINFGFDPFKVLKYTFTQTKTTDLYLKQEVKFSEKNQISLNLPTFFYINNSLSYNNNYTETDNPRYSLTSNLGSKSIRLDKSFSVNGSLEWQKFIEDISGKPKPPKQRFQREKSSKEEWDAEEQSKDGEPPETKKKSVKKIDEKKENEDGEKADEKKKPGTGLRTKVLMGVSKSLSPITLDYSKTNNINFSGIKDRPDFMIRFGQGTIEEPDSVTVISRKNAKSLSTSYSARTKIDLPLDIGISASGKYNETDMNSPSTNSASKNSTPLDLKMNWGKLEEKIPYAKRFLSNLALNSSYSRTNTKSWQDGRRTSDKNDKKFSPLISVSGKVLNRVQASFSLDTGNKLSSDYSGKTTSYSENITKNTNYSLRYSISSSKGILFFKNLKLNSDINISLTFGTQSSETKRGIGDEPMALISSNDSWSLSPNADYKFSRKFRGGMQMTFRNSIDMTKKVRKVREVSIWGEMMF